MSDYERCFAGANSFSSAGATSAFPPNVCPHQPFPSIHGEVRCCDTQYIQPLPGEYGHHCKPKRKYWVRPVDSTRRGAWGRLKDGLTGSGPDVFVVAANDRKSLHRELPRHNDWTNWDSTGYGWTFDDRQRYMQAIGSPPGASLRDMSWARRELKEVYNYRTRKYERLDGGRYPWRYWSDARWPGDERRKGQFPVMWRDSMGVWRNNGSVIARPWPWQWPAPSMGLS